MFAILLSEKMDPFYQNVSSFPTVFFTFMLLVCVMFWLVAVLGLVDIGVLDVAEVDIDFGDMDVSPSGVAGLLLKLGLNGVPLTIIVSLISLFGWLFSYYIVYFLFDPIIDTFFRFIFGVPALLVSLTGAVFVTAFLIKPIRPLFQKMQQEHQKNVLGQVAIVRTSRVDDKFGEAVLEDGGAGLILKVRTRGDDVLNKNDRVVLFEYNEVENTYRVVSEEEFHKIKS